MFFIDFYQLREASWGLSYWFWKQLFYRLRYWDFQVVFWAVYLWLYNSRQVFSRHCLLSYIYYEIKKFLKLKLDINITAMKTFEGEAKLKELPPITKEYEYLLYNKGSKPFLTLIFKSTIFLPRVSQMSKFTQLNLINKISIWLQVHL